MVKQVVIPSILIIFLNFSPKAEAQFLDISALDGRGATYLLEPGRFDVVPVQGNYTAWRPWDPDYCPEAGCWVHGYAVDAPEIGSVYHGWNGGSHPTAAGALSAATILTLDLTYAQRTTFYIPDDPYDDNAGGVSLSLVRRAENLDIPDRLKEAHAQAGFENQIVSTIGMVAACANLASCITSIAPELLGAGSGSGFGLAIGVGGALVGAAAAISVGSLGGMALASVATVGVFAGYMSGQHYRWADDPPDLNFQEIVAVEKPSFFWEFGDSPELDEAFAEMYNSLAYAGLIMDAGITSYERWQGATILGDANAAALQMAAYKDFKEQVDASRAMAADSLSEFTALLEQAGLGDLVLDTDYLDLLKSDIDANGVPQAISSLLNSELFPYSEADFVYWLNAFPSEAYGSGALIANNFHAISASLQTAVTVPLGPCAPLFGVALLILLRLRRSRIE